MPKLFDRVLLTLSCFGFAGILLGGFLNFAPNRLARGVASAIWQAPLVDAAVAIAGLSGLALLSFAPGNKRRSIATILAAVLILCGTLAGAGHLAALLMQAGPPAARVVAGTRVLDLDQRRASRGCRCHAKRQLRLSCTRLCWGGSMFGIRRDGGGRGVRSSVTYQGIFE